MTIDVIGSATQVAQAVVGKTAVVIDVLRATSVMVTALANGADQVIPVVSPEEAFQIKKQMGDEIILGGERNAFPIEGFDYGNSPLQYTPEVVSGKTLVMTTTNGTLAINNAAGADELLIASFLNDKAILRKLEKKEEIVFICSGTDGQFTLEDAVCAGYLIDQLVEQKGDFHMSDMGIAVHQLYRSNQQDVKALAAKGKHYRNLEKKGYTADLDYCFQTDVFDSVPVLNGKVLKNTTC